MHDFLTVVKTGVNITTGAASVRVALPTAQSGQIPRFVRIAAINPCHVVLGTATTNAVATDTLVQPADAVVLHVPQGITHICAIQTSAAGLVNIVALENC